MDSENSNLQKEETCNPFQPSAKVVRSPTAPTATGDKRMPSKKARRESLSQMILSNDKGDKTSLEYANQLVDDLSAFVAARSNIHNDVKVMVVKLQKALQDADKEWKSLEESTRSKIAEIESKSTPVSRLKRSRPSPEIQQTTSTAKKQRNAALRSENGSDNLWRTVASKKAKSSKPSKPPRPKESKTVRQKSDALVLTSAKDSLSYGDILRKVKNDPDLKELGTHVARIRRTKNGNMLFELNRDSYAKSAAFKGLVEKSLGTDVTVRALTQEVVVECRNLDEVTTEEELREALIEQFTLGDLGKAAPIKLRKAYGETQIATIKLPVAEANKLLEKGKIRVGWTICPMRQTQQQLLRCFRCMGFGHQAKQCTGTDRSKRCWKCGEEGHVGKTCTGKPKCMLCQESDGNNHPTGGLKCKAYLEAKARKEWK
jgi:hypothetical protein